jgi:hypothetical protein
MFCGGGRHGLRGTVPQERLRTFIVSSHDDSRQPRGPPPERARIHHAPMMGRSGHTERDTFTGAGPGSTTAR